MAKDIETIRLQFTEGVSNKFWEITKMSRGNPAKYGPQTQYGYKTTWGRIGSDEQTLAEHKWKWFSTESTCDTKITEIKNRKIRKGYVPVSRRTHDPQEEQKKKNPIQMRIRSMNIT